MNLGSALALVIGVLGKIARDVSLLMQSEVAETAEPAAPGRGGSSTMPHKQNPVGCAVMLAAAIRAPHLAATLFAAMPQEHERGLGGWHAEWETLPELFLLASGSLGRGIETIAGLKVSSERMRENLDITGGLVNAEAVMMALASHVGRDRAYHLVEEASRTARRDNRTLRDVLLQDSTIAEHLSASALEAIFNPATQVVHSKCLVDRLLASRRRSQGAP